jgi:hypothetical protein
LSFFEKEHVGMDTSLKRRDSEATRGRLRGRNDLTNR